MINFFSSIPAEIYQDFYTSFLFGLCFIVAIYYFTSQNNDNIRRNLPFTQLVALVLSILIIFFVGFRPVSSVFVDMGLYVHTYNNILDGYNVPEDSRGEWLFYAFGNLCKRNGLSDVMYIFLMDVGYFGLMFVTCWRLMRRNLFVALLFCFASFSCFTYGVNGMRNGMACSIVMLSITFLSEGTWKKVIAIILMYLAYSFHHSTALPSFCALSAMLFVKNTRYAIYFWIASIFISLVAGNLVTEMFVNLGFDDRMEQYANLDEFGEVMESSNEKAGFRIDFILYSIMPIIMVWYITIKRNFKDLTYHIIATTYILANAFWIMVIRSEQSNRFAYLSWFIYPLVIAYPLLRMNIWEDQDKKTGIILLLYSSFTFFMHFIYYGK